MRLGYAWEDVMLDFGFERYYATSVDLISYDKKIAIQLKNGWRQNAATIRSDTHDLEEYGTNNPGWELIFGHINWKNDDRGQEHMTGRVSFRYGFNFRHHILGDEQNHIILQLRGAAGKFFLEDHFVRPSLNM